MPFVAQWVRVDGDAFPVGDLATLQRWILERRITAEDAWSPDGATWHSLGARPELAIFFAAAEQLGSAVASPLPGLGPPAPAQATARFPDVPVDPTEVDTLSEAAKNWPIDDGETIGTPDSHATHAVVHERSAPVTDETARPEPRPVADGTTLIAERADEPGPMSLEGGPTDERPRFVWGNPGRGGEEEPEATEYEGLHIGADEHTVEQDIRPGAELSAPIEATDGLGYRVGAAAIGIAGGSTAAHALAAAIDDPDAPEPPSGSAEPPEAEVEARFFGLAEGRSLGGMTVVPDDVPGPPPVPATLAALPRPSWAEPAIPPPMEVEPRSEFFADRPQSKPRTYAAWGALVLILLTAVAMAAVIAFLLVGRSTPPADVAVTTVPRALTPTASAGSHAPDPTASAPPEAHAADAHAPVATTDTPPPTDHPAPVVTAVAHSPPAATQEQPAPKPVSRKTAPAEDAPSRASGRRAAEPGWKAVEAGELTTAYDYFSKALQGDPRNVFLLYGRGYVSERMGDPVSAGQDYCSAIAAGSASTELMRELDSGLRRTGRSCG